MLYRRNFRPYSVFDRRRNLYYPTPEIALQPVEDVNEKPVKSELSANEKSGGFSKVINHPYIQESQPPILHNRHNEERVGDMPCPFICRVFNVDFYLDDLVLLGLILLLLQDWHDDYILLFALIFLFIIGKL